MTARAAKLLASEGLLALAPVAATGDLLSPATDVAIVSLDDATSLHLDAAGVALLQAWTSRVDRVFVFDEARPALRRLLRAGVNVRRPICRATLETLASGKSTEETGNIAHSLLSASARASHVLATLPDVLARIDARGHKRVARLENLVLPAFAAMEDRGLYIDQLAWRALVEVEDGRARTARADVIAHAGAHLERDLFGEPNLNLDADADVRALLARVLGLLPSAAAELGIHKHALRSVAHPIAEALVRYREAQKMCSTYGEAFLSRLDARTGRMHAHFVPLGASTGRVASHDPNLQNLPTDERFVACLTPPAQRARISADYGTCELRIVAELSGDPVFLAAFADGKDLHATVASQMFGVPVTKTENEHLRQRAKAINFGLVYGMGAQALAASLSVPFETGQELLATYFRNFPRIRDYLESSVDVALRRGYAETILGRRLVLSDEQLKQPNARGELSRILKNMPIQGTSADMTKLAMVHLHEALATAPTAGLVNTVHDELVIECDAADAEHIAAVVQREMAAAHTTLLKRVPALVEVNIERRSTD